MGTRTVVKVIGKHFSCNLYHHWDGYPEGVGLDLMKMFYERLHKKMDKNNPLERELDFNDIVNELIKNPKDDGYILTEYEHFDIEYEYEINVPQKTIRCWACEHNWSEYKMWRGKEISLIEIYKEHKGDVEND